MIPGFFDGLGIALLTIQDIPYKPLTSKRLQGFRGKGAVSLQNFLWRCNR